MSGRPASLRGVDSDPNVADLLVGALAALAVVLTAVIAAFSAYAASKRQRRRQMYGEATKAALAWLEMLHRVRRRGGRPDDEAEIVERFHELQDSIGYFQGWIGSESKYLSRSYQRFVVQIKACVAEPLRAAWANPPSKNPGRGGGDGQSPDAGEATDRFLKDVRSHMSPWPWRKFALAWRNRGA